MGTMRWVASLAALVWAVYTLAPRYGEALLALRAAEAALNNISWLIRR